MSTFIASFLRAKKCGNNDLLLHVLIIYLIHLIYRISKIIYFPCNSYSHILIFDIERGLLPIAFTYTLTSSLISYRWAHIHSLLRNDSYCCCYLCHLFAGYCHHLGLVLLEHHSHQLEEQRTSSFACRTQAWLGMSLDVDILLGMPNIGYSFFLVERYRLHHPCTML